VTLPSQLKFANTLFHPVLKMRWKNEGPRVKLLLGDRMIWEWVSSQDWDSPVDVENFIISYRNTPLSDLVQRQCDGVQNRGWWHPRLKKQMADLLDIFLAADRRIGRRTQSLWMFMGHSSMAQNISAMRC
jgi:hypothetical protein